MSRHFLICDDHAIVRDAIAAMLEQEFPGCRLTLAGDFQAAIQQIAETAPDLIISDLMMPDLPPREGIARLQAQAPLVPICVLTGSQDEALMVWLLQAGVAGFVGKFSSGEVILGAARLVLAGGRYIPPEVLNLIDQADHPPPADEAVFLSPQQRRVLALVAKGQSNKEVAAALGIAPSTIKTHLDHAMRALGVSSRYAAVSKARELGLIPS
ncbi:response regulator transcription factor [Novosphingobium sp.]|uniref:response regulator transcription factor n=1 Tax=Novosphingobium sp. TaxID=1874826 RepID=UPI0025F130E1|nr:response regulator transcription factor [Novosphingobium sp.]MCC6926755.1 response regulator transcription factor [Novosphingobium sp.]